MTNHRRLHSLSAGALAFIGLVLGGCYTQVRTPEPVGMPSTATFGPTEAPLEDLKQARKLWSEAGITSYNYGMRVHSANSYSYSVVVEVANGQFRKIDRKSVV